MNIVNKVTLQHMKQNRKKTLVTLIGIILSVALITAISSFAESFLDMMRRDIIASDGEWHVLFSGYPTDRLEELEQDENVKGVLKSRSLGCAALEECANPDKGYLSVRAYDELAMQEYPLRLQEGRLPENSGEIVLPAHLEENGGMSWQVGDVITLELGTRVQVWSDGNGEGENTLEDTDSYLAPDEEAQEELKDPVSRTFTVVGIVERPGFEPYYSGAYLAFTFLDEAILRETGRVNAAVQLKKLTSSLYDWSVGAAAAAGTTVSYHTALLSYYLLSSRSGVVTMLNSLKTILILIVMLGSVAGIYSSFAISVSERSKYLGMLASVGATKRQKRRSVFFEGFLLGIVGIPLGLLVGLLGTWVTMQLFVNPVLGRALSGMSETGETMSMRMVVSLPALAGASLAAAVTIAVSAWIPARRASKITPMDAIRQTQDVKLTRRQVRVSPLTKMLFGFSGELALKNLKRNKRRYRATVLSLILCIALFLSVSAFSIYLSDAYLFSMRVDENTADIQVNLTAEASESEAVRQEILGLEGITRWTEYRGTTTSCYLDRSFFSEAARQAADQSYLPRNEEGQQEAVLIVTLLDEETMRTCLRNAGVREEDLAEDGTHPVLVENVFRYDDQNTVHKETLLNLQPGDTLNVSLISYEGTETTTGISMRIAGLMTEAPFGWGLQEQPSTLRVYTTAEVHDNLMESRRRQYEDLPATLYLEAEQPLAVYEKILALQKENPAAISYVYSAEAEKQQMDQLLLLMDIFIYSFIILTSLICVTSIFNTISTGMALRRREYAMLESVGMDGKQFHRMIRYESLFYGLKALLYGLPIGLFLMWLIYQVIAQSFDTGFYILWRPIGAAIVSVMVIVGLTMWYSMRKIEKANIVETLKDENI